MLTWESDERCVIGDVVFQILPSDLLQRERPGISLQGADFLLFKPRSLIERYVEWIEELQPRNIVELGILEGGGTALLHELARPRRMLALDRKPPTVPALRDLVDTKGLGDVVRTHTDVDQSDRGRLAAIVDDVFGDEPLDLVVDDCSHLYEQTRASFNELFPRLRPGGLYTIEDWPWAHEEPLETLWADETPLTRLIFELVLAIPAVPGLIDEVEVNADAVQIRRGGANVDRSGFQISDCTNPRGRRLLGPQDA